MNYKILEKPAFLCIGIEMRTENAPEKAMKDIPALWEKFYKEHILDQIPNKISFDVYGLYTDYEEDYTKPYSLIIGCMVSSLEQIPEGMVGKKIPAAKYAVFTAKGAFPESLIRTWNEIWKTPLARKYLCDFEWYGPRFADSEHPEVDVFIGIE